MAREILSLGLWPASHLLIVTADSSEDLLGRDTALGIRDVLLKRVNASLLFAGAIRLMGGVRDEPPALPPTAPSDKMPALKGVEGSSWSIQTREPPCWSQRSRSAASASSLLHC